MSPDARPLLPTFVGALATALLLAPPSALASESTPEPPDSPCEAPSPAQDAPVLLPGRLAVNALRDTRGFSTLGVNAFLVLPRGLSVFGFVDLDNKYADMPPADSSQAYSELNLFADRWKTAPIGLHAQWALGTSPFVTDRVRLGARLHAPPSTGLGGWLAEQDLTVTLTWFPVVQTLDLAMPTSWESQVSAFYVWRPLSELLDGRLELTGWGDLDVRVGKEVETSAITEHLVALRILGPLRVAVELRHASFEPETHGVGVGVEIAGSIGVPIGR